MTKITASLGLAALEVLASGISAGKTVTGPQIDAVAAGLRGLVMQGLEPTPEQAEAVNDSIDQLFAAPEPSAEPDAQPSA